MRKTLQVLFSAMLAATTLAPSAMKAQTPSTGGPYDVPYSCLWNDQKVLVNKEWTVEDKNNDGITWGFSNDVPGSFISYIGTAQKQDADDWLVSPYLAFEAGKTYKVETGGFKAMGGSQKLAVAIGTGDDPTTYKVIGDYTISATYDGGGATPVEGEFIAPTTGKYRVAFHCTSNQRAYLLLLPVKVFAQASLAVRPAAVNDLNVEVGAKGAVSAKVSFTTPSTDYAGNALSGLTRVQLYRDYVQVKNYDAPALGTKIEWTDDEVVTGEHTYSVIATANDLRSDEVVKKAYVGYDRPLPPQNIKIYDHLNGKATITWDPVSEVGMHGGYVDPKTAEYTVNTLYYGYLKPVEQGLTTTKCVVEDVNYDGAQSAVQYAIYTYVDSPTSDTAVVSDAGREAFIIGQAHEIPYYESFANKSLQKGPWVIDANCAGKFGLSEDAQDEDAGSLVFNPSTGSTLACIQGPKVDIANAGNPQIVFWYYAYPGTDGKITVKVNRNGQEMVEVGTVDYSTLSGKMGWRSVAMDLKSVSTVGVKNGYIRPYFYAEGLSTSIMIDNIKIYDAIENNLAADIDAPAHVQSGKAAQLNVKVTNLGTAKASGYKVHLFIDGKKFETEEGEDLEPNAVATYEFAYTPKLHVGKFTVRGEVEWAADMFQANNKSIDYTVEVVSSPLPAINDLAATDKGVLTWSAMDVDGVKVTDDFESYTPWSIARVGDWTLYDGDKGTVYTFGGIQHPNSGVAQAYIVFNPWQVSGLAATYMQQFAEIFAPHSGKQSMMSTGTTIDTGTPTNNWLITPELSGEEQTISFWVNAPGDEVNRGEQNPNSGPETFDIYYSEDDTNANSFIKINKDSYEAVYKWTKYDIALPEGAKYFAIVHTSTGSLTSYNFEPDRLCVDDVTYRAGGLRVMGYNVYRDGVLVKKLDGKTTTWTDEKYTDDNGYGAGNHKYNVIVVYANGESNVSNTVYVGDPAAGVDSVVVNGVKTNNRVYTINGKYVGKSLKDVKQGLYIQNGKKVVVK